MCTPRYRLEEAVVAKVGRKSPESGRQAIEVLAVPTGLSYWLPFAIEVPRMQASFPTVIDGLLYLREGHAGCSMVDIAIVVE